MRGHPGTHWEGEADIRDAEINMAVHSTNNQDQFESLWVKCEGGALVWFANLMADQGTEAEFAGVHQQEPEDHPADLVAKKDL